MARLKLREIAEAAEFDPKQALLTSLGDLIREIEPFHNWVMVAQYVRPEKTAGGIIRPDRTLQEDRFQGKVGLVLKWGPLAFQDDSVAKFGGVRLKEHDWVFYRASDTWEMHALDKTEAGTSCRFIEDSKIIGRTTDPAMIW